MRARPLVLLLLAVLLLPAAGAQPVEGRGYGVDAFYASAGLWHAYGAQHGGGLLTLDLTWGAFLLATDYDMTLYRPDALNDGVLTQDEAIARAWTYSRSPREEQIAVTVPPGEYIVTVEPIQSDGQTYRLDSNAALRSLALTPGVKIGL